MGDTFDNQGLEKVRSESARPQCVEMRPRMANHGLRIAILSSGLALGLAFFLALKPTSARVVWEEFARIIELKNGLKIGSPAGPRSEITAHLSERLAAIGPQQQAELLVEATAAGYDASIGQLSARMESWRGRLTMSPRLAALLDEALNASDLRVRSAAIEMELIAYDLPKTSTTADQLIQRIDKDPAGRPWALWMLGAIGNRGVEQEQALQILVQYSRDSDQKTRFWAVEGLSILGTDATIQPLLAVFRRDPSLETRHQAGFGLARSGMLTKKQRLAAVPALIAFGEDPSLDSNTRNWAYEALRDITGARYGTNPTDWHEWWAENSPR